ncbi:DUF1538 domain-containing protein [Herbivorax sp. ANBcel31]|uniref:DUF1538 domain-containing protein n=1 Tax=Herbivorax sp. ANBcel31 TaxID=3069754 RepID=UPI0027B45DAB|nr:DUF1538 domain-containing protein [Herbivorax sp. ANBcel31]MDQ2086572.1 DUF1538 domain-containing protein [Herbivorax sp. ANBcel31]
MVSVFFDGIFDVIKEVFLALLPLLVIFMLFQFYVLNLPKKEVVKTIWGIICVFFGFVLFLQGVDIGYFSTGEYIGMSLISMENNWLLVPIGFVFGFTIAFAEPALRILNTEIEKVTGGHIKQNVVLFSISIGVAVSVALSMLRILTGISLWYFIIPGYIIAFIIAKFVGRVFVGIAFDSGGVVTGPMIVTLLLSLTVGASKTLEGSNPLVEGFGMVALVSMIPIISVLVLGFLYERKVNVE